MSRPLSPAGLARCIEHTLWRADASSNDIKALCTEAREHGFVAVCLNPLRIELARHLLEETEIKVVALVGFPLGTMDSDTKRFETEVAIDNGAQEIDVVLNLGQLKDGDDQHVLRELRDVVEAADERLVKVILETRLLTREETIRACHLVLDSGAQFVAAATGFPPGDTPLEDVKLVREIVGPKFGVKASGNIRDHALAVAIIAAGATRLGTTNSVSLVQRAPASGPANPAD